jgi:hypothetical protein
VTENVRASVASRGDRRHFVRPHREFRNWSKYFSLPWLCFIDIAVFSLYVLFAYYHQRSQIAFMLDFTESIQAYFLQDVELPTPPQGIPIGDGQITYVDQFLDLVNRTCERFWLFPDSFPVAYPLVIWPAANLTINLFNGSTIVHFFNQSTAPSATALVTVYLTNFSTIRIAANYHLQVTAETHDSRLGLDIIAMFTRDTQTDTIFMDMSHTNIQEKSDFSVDTILGTLDDSIPLLIIFLNVVAILIIITFVYQLVIYTRKKAIESGLKPKVVFRRKFDRWTLFAFVAHLVSIGACIMYIQVGQDVQETVPPVLYALSAATVLHSLLLIRYLKLKQSTMLIMTVFYKSAIKILQFLIGCLPIYAGFLAFAVCFFGHLNETFATGMQCASFLFCVMHGDSIKDMYDRTMIQNDMSVYLGFIYTSLWLAFSLLIMFNITISIVQEVLQVETDKVEPGQRREPEIQALDAGPAEFSGIQRRGPF